MKKKRGNLFLLIGFSLLIFLAFSAWSDRGVRHTFISLGISMKNMLASTFFVDSITESDLLARYEKARKRGRPVKIIIVAGHDDKSPGAVYRDRREADMNVKLAEALAGFLSKDKEFETVLTRLKDGYNPIFWDFRERNKNTLYDFISSKKLDMRQLMEAGSVHDSPGVKHNKAPEEFITTLYSVNRWANESAADIVIHIHFNDAAGRRREVPWDHSGFSIYIPEKQYSNAKASRALAKSIFGRLSRFYPASDLPIEDAGLVESQDLIAVGAYNTLDSAGMLIEYGYIYEPQFETSEVRAKTITELAWQTYLGLHDFFKTAKSEKLAIVGSLGELDQPIEKDSRDKDLILDLQKALLLIDAYPPAGKTIRECPLSGNFGKCTETALNLFQSREEIKGEEGRVGERTLKSLRDRLSVYKL